MAEEKDTTSNAIHLNENWEAYWVDKEFGWMIRCREHPTKNLVLYSSEEGVFVDCLCIAPNEIWKKLIFLDKLSKM